MSDFTQSLRKWYHLLKARRNEKSGIWPKNIRVKRTGFWHYNYFDTPRSKETEILIDQLLLITIVVTKGQSKIPLHA